ncbi:MAG: hypothetical protein UHM23_06885 [Clostridia bacterium]|nr:hypothetical protein [Clostridia bacterium]
MITASVNFFENNLMADLTCKDIELSKQLTEMGVITPPNQIPLNNALTLKVFLQPDNEIGQMVYDIVDFEIDTLGNVRKLCRHIYCLNSQNTRKFTAMLENGSIRTVNQGIAVAQKLREKSVQVR